MRTTTTLILAILAVSFAADPGWAAQPPGEGGTAAHGSSEIQLERTQPLPSNTETCVLGRDSKGYPTAKAAVNSDAVEFLDASGKVQKVIARRRNDDQKMQTHIYKGKHGKVIGVHVTRGYSSSRESWTSGEYFVFDQDGNETLHIEQFNDITRPVPSPSGDYAVGWPSPTTPGGPPIFYDARGVRNKWAHGFSGEGWPAGFEVNDVTFSSDGQVVGVNAKKGRKRRALVFNSNGDKLCEVDDGENVLFSPSRTRFAYYKRGHGVALADINGSEAWVTPTEAYPAKFSVDEKRLLVRSGGFLAMIDVATGKELWRWSRKQERLAGKNSSGQVVQTRMPQFSLRNVDSPDDLSVIVVLGMAMKFEYLKPDQPQRRLVVDKDYMFMLDGDGNLLQEKALPGGTFAVPDAPMVFSQDGGTVAVAGDGKISYFRIGKGSSHQ